MDHQLTYFVVSKIVVSKNKIKTRKTLVLHLHQAALFGAFAVQESRFGSPGHIWGNGHGPYFSPNVELRIGTLHPVGHTVTLSLSHPMGHLHTSQQLASNTLKLSSHASCEEDRAFCGCKETTESLRAANRTRLGDHTAAPGFKWPKYGFAF